MKQLKKIPDKFANLLNFLHFQPLISGEAAASPISTPLFIQVDSFLQNYQGKIYQDIEYKY